MDRSGKSLYVLRSARNLHSARVCQQTLLVLTVLLVFFGLAEVFDERTRTKRIRDCTYSYLIVKPLGNPLKPCSLHFNLQHILKKPRLSHLPSSIPTHRSHVLPRTEVLLYQCLIVTISSFTLLKGPRSSHPKPALQYLVFDDVLITENAHASALQSWPASTFPTGLSRGSLQKGTGRSLCEVLHFASYHSDPKKAHTLRRALVKRQSIRRRLQWVCSRRLWKHWCHLTSVFREADDDVQMSRLWILAQ